MRHGKRAGGGDGPARGAVAYHLKTLARGDILRPARSGTGHEPGEAHYGWTLGVEAELLRLVLQVWAESDVSG